MQSLDQLHRQLETIGDLRTVVKTMKALSAANIRQYEQAVVALAGYHQTVQRGLHVVLRGMGTAPSPLPPRAARRTIIAFGSDLGLCGRFNEGLVEHLDISLPTLDGGPQAPLMLVVGARAAADLENNGHPVAELLSAPSSAGQITATVQQILLQIDRWREEEQAHHVYLLYNRRSEGGGYTPNLICLAPIDLQRLRMPKAERWPSRSLPTFTMDSGRLLSRLLHQYVFVLVFRACAESLASEHASRLRAMQAAERNLDDRLEETRTHFRRARQAAITSELLDVVAGFETTAPERR